MQCKAQLGRQALANPMLSDAQLSTQLAHHNLVAFDRIYDRYATLVYTLLCDVVPGAADTLLADVFELLWQRAQQFAGEGLLARVLALTAETVAGQGARRQPIGWGGPLLPALAPYSYLPNDVFEVLVLRYLGGLEIAEIATALGHDQSNILHMLVTNTPGVTPLRQLEGGIAS